jgi:hypothetical protein
MTTLKEATATIRTALKAMGYSSREISVRGESYSMGSSITVTVKVRGVDLKAIKAVAEKAQRIDRCELTGEILTGGNRFVEVDYSWELVRELSAQVRAEAEVALASMKANPGVAVAVAGAEYYYTGNSHEAVVDLATRAQVYGTADCLADHVARKLAEQPAPAATVAA